ncbi:hypothetical protein GXN74_00535 [Clostridiales bacterium F-3ap]|uniref:Flavoprotein domain-containing protein n=2 Tax=Anaerotalea alkaliphila TaxID=2662126 RepID=A0A7X5HT85_9FIRM|nr:hypothetical protein [Anaerotalea alkaliphila]
MQGLNIVVGVSGGIACYKAVELVGALVKLGHHVDVVMTRNAEEFVTPLTFQTMSRNRVVRGMFDKVDRYDTEHISLAKRAQVFIVVPATANIIGKIAGGIADDMLTTTIMAAKCRKIIAPAMNTAMWENPILQENLEKLRRHGYEVLGTASGRLACGDLGEGKLLPWEEILEIVVGKAVMLDRTDQIQTNH